MEVYFFKITKKKPLNNDIYHCLDYKAMIFWH